MALNLLALTRYELCALLANHNDTTVEDEQQWLAGYTFVKQLGPNEALYLVAQHDDEGPNAYEGVCCCYAHVCRNAQGVVTLRWAQWEPAM